MTKSIKNILVLTILSAILLAGLASADEDWADVHSGSAIEPQQKSPSTIEDDIETVDITISTPSPSLLNEPIPSEGQDKGAQTPLMHGVSLLLIVVVLLIWMFSIRALFKYVI